MKIETILLLPIIYLLVVSVPIMISNIRENRIKNKYVLPGHLVWLVSATTYTALSGNWLNGLVLPLVVGLALLIAFTIISSSGIVGMGDVKIVILMGLTLSWKFLLVWLWLPLSVFVIGLLVALYSTFVTRKAKEVIRLGGIIYAVYIAHLLVLFF